MCALVGRGLSIQRGSRFSGWYFCFNNPVAISFFVVYIFEVKVDALGNQMRSGKR